MAVHAQPGRSPGAITPMPEPCPRVLAWRCAATLTRAERARAVGMGRQWGRVGRVGVVAVGRRGGDASHQRALSSAVCRR